ncbi:MAG: hypothetical protein KDD35_01550 [Bdellovibrionales bacterium]|nr:hypothetical protein [Bdellovibrionales bacterium]
MKIWFCPYELQPHLQLNANDEAQTRDGVLLKIQLADGGVGFSDCHPWIQFKDADWREQIKSLKEDRPLPLISRSLELALWDSSSRSRGISLFPKQPLLKSHYTLTDTTQFSLAQLQQIVAQGYDVVKLKLGRDLRSDREFLRRLIPIAPEQLKLRLDFNLKPSFEELMNWFEGLGQDIRERFDFIEDPFEYSLDSWSTFKERWGCPLAIDQSLSADMDLAAADVLIIKPGRVNGETINTCVEKWGHKRWVFTHSMDHPVGRMMALGFAMNFYQVNPEKVEVGGFESAEFYKRTLFDDQIYQDGALQLGTDGAGIGFDAQLEELDWETLLP